MGNKVIVRKNGVEEEFEDILGHQVGNGAIQILFMKGGSRIIFSPDDIDVILDEEASEDFEKKLAMQMEEANQAEVRKSKAPVDGPENVVVPIKH